MLALYTRLWGRKKMLGQRPPPSLMSDFLTYIYPVTWTEPLPHNGKSGAPQPSLGSSRGSCLGTTLSAIYSSPVNVRANIGGTEQETKALPAQTAQHQSQGPTLFLKHNLLSSPSAPRQDTFRHLYSRPHTECHHPPPLCSPTGAPAHATLSSSSPQL